MLLSEAPDYTGNPCRVQERRVLSDYCDNQGKTGILPVHQSGWKPLLRMPRSRERQRVESSAWATEATPEQ